MFHLIEKCSTLSIVHKQEMQNKTVADAHDASRRNRFFLQGEKLFLSRLGVGKISTILRFSLTPRSARVKVVFPQCCGGRQLAGIHVRDKRLQKEFVVFEVEPGLLFFCFGADCPQGEICSRLNVVPTSNLQTIHFDQTKNSNRPSSAGKSVPRSPS